MDHDIQRDLVSAFPKETYAMTIRAIREGIVLADDCIDNHPFLNILTGRDLIGHIRRAGMLFRMHELCVTGDLPFISEITKMPRANWHQQSLRSGKFIGNLVRTDSEFAFPDDKPSRQDERLINQPDLFQDPKIVPLSTIADEISEMTAWLMYRLNRAGNIQHLCWGVPFPDTDDWIAHIDILKSAGSELPTSAAEAKKTPDPRTAMRFRDEINDQLQDRKKDDKSNGKE